MDGRQTPRTVHSVDGYTIIVTDRGNHGKGQGRSGPPNQLQRKGAPVGRMDDTQGSLDPTERTGDLGGSQHIVRIPGFPQLETNRTSVRQLLQRRDPMALERRRVHQGFQGSAGRPLSLYQKINLPELADKLPKKCLPMGALVGTLTRQAAVDLNLPEDLPVAQVSV